MNVADHIVMSIINDLSDRRGLGDEWDAIDDEVQEEIRLKWQGIVHAELDEALREFFSRGGKAKTTS